MDTRVKPAYDGLKASPIQRRLLTSVPISVTSRQSRSPKGRQPATPADGARAVPAGGGSSPPLPGGSGNTPGRHDDRSARSSLDWDRKARVTPVSSADFRTIGICAPTKSQEARSGAELWRWVAAASAVVERRQASALRLQRAAASVDARQWNYAPAGVPLPFCLLGMIEPKAGPTAGLGVTRSCSAGRFCEWRWHNSGAHASRERICFFHLSPRAGRGRVSEASEGEGASPRF